MAKKTRRVLEYESWLRRIKAALINVEGAASLWGGCVSEVEYCEKHDPQRRFMEAVDNEYNGLDQTVSENLQQKLWDLAEDMAKAIARGEEAMQKTEVSDAE